MTLTLSAYAKVNLTLEILGKRDDGYHDIASVLQTVSLADTLRFEDSRSLELVCSDPHLQSDDNLVLKAARLLKETTGSDKGAAVHLSKSIPPAAGLGSGATDAAATLIGLNALWDLRLPGQRLIELAARLGSDVPALLLGGTVLARGRGERVTRLLPVNDLRMVVVNPALEPVPGKTGRMYGLMQPSDFTSGGLTDVLAAHIEVGGRVDSSLLCNAFERAAYDFFPGLYDYRSQFVGAGADRVHLAGAGPALYALPVDSAQAEAVVGRLVAHGLEAYHVTAVDSQSRPCLGDSTC